MKAVQFAKYGGPEVLQVSNVPDPTPGPEDVLIQVKATTVNHLDLFQRDGGRPVDKLPFTPGLEAAGVVLNDSHGFHAGERVMTTRATAAKGGGGYASKIAVPATDLVRIPNAVTFEQAAAAGLTASTALDLGRFKWPGITCDPVRQACWLLGMYNNKQQPEGFRITPLRGRYGGQSERAECWPGCTRCRRC